MNGTVTTLMMKMKLLPLLREELSRVHLQSMSTLQVSQFASLCFMFILVWFLYLHILYLLFLLCKGSPRARTTTSRRKRRLQNTPMTLGSLTLCGSPSGPSCSRAVTFLPGRTPVRVPWTKGLLSKFLLYVIPELPGYQLLEILWHFVTWTYCTHLHRCHETVNSVWHCAVICVICAACWASGMLCMKAAVFSQTFLLVRTFFVVLWLDVYMSLWRGMSLIMAFNKHQCMWEHVGLFWIRLLCHVPSIYPPSAASLRLAAVSKHAQISLSPDTSCSSSGRAIQEIPRDAIRFIQVLIHVLFLVLLLSNVHFSSEPCKCVSTEIFRATCWLSAVN